MFARERSKTERAIAIARAAAKAQGRQQRKTNRQESYLDRSFMSLKDRAAANLGRGRLQLDSVTQQDASARGWDTNAREWDTNDRDWVKDRASIRQNERKIGIEGYNAFTSRGRLNLEGDRFGYKQFDDDRSFRERVKKDNRYLTTSYDAKTGAESTNVAYYSDSTSKGEKLAGPLLGLTDEELSVALDGMSAEDKINLSNYRNHVLDRDASYNGGRRAGGQQRDGTSYAPRATFELGTRENRNAQKSSSRYAQQDGGGWRKVDISGGRNGAHEKLVARQTERLPQFLKKYKNRLERVSSLNTANNPPVPRSRSNAPTVQRSAKAQPPAFRPNFTTGPGGVYQSETPEQREAQIKRVKANLHRGSSGVYKPQKRDGSRFWGDM